MPEVTCFVTESPRVSSIFFSHGLQYSLPLLGLGRRGEAKEGGKGADMVMVRTFAQF